ncbi:hypothetical protein [Thiorhodovibrio frisius]|nr:hypothetical protein [Thiorhodovibrio frisius]
MSDATLDDIFGMTEAEWQGYYERKLDQHELFSVLALFEACEGGFRRDLSWRGQRHHRQKHHARFRKLLDSQRSNDHLAMAVILDQWIVAEKSKPWLRKLLMKLKVLFQARNELAHGRTGESADFDVVFSQLDSIRQKWRDAVEDFRGY